MNLLYTYTGKDSLDKGWALIDKSLKSNLQIIVPKRNYSLFGCGKAAERCIEFLHRMGKNIKCFYDNDESRWNTTYKGIRILPPQEIKEGGDEIIITSAKYEKEITEQLERQGLEKNIDFICFSDVIYMIGEKAYMVMDNMEIVPH